MMWTEISPGSAAELIAVSMQDRGHLPSYHEAVRFGICLTAGENKEEETVLVVYFKKN